MSLKRRDGPFSRDSYFRYTGSIANLYKLNVESLNEEKKNIHFAPRYVSFLKIPQTQRRNTRPLAQTFFPHWPLDLTLCAYSFPSITPLPPRYCTLLTVGDSPTFPELVKQISLILHSYLPKKSKKIETFPFSKKSVGFMIFFLFSRLREISHTY